MLKTRKLVADSFSEVYDLVKPYLSHEFWNFEEHEPIEHAVYLLGRRQFSLNVDKIKDLVSRDYCKIILSNPSEGSETMKGQCISMDVVDLVRSGKILLIGGGDMDPSFPCLQYDAFLTKIQRYEENLLAMQRSNEIYDGRNKPYKFLFLNGRMRSHRKYLLERFSLSGLLDQSLWSCLDARDGVSRRMTCMHQGQDLMYTVRPVKFLPPQYEVEKYAGQIDRPLPAESFVKHHLFQNDWGEVYIKPEQYIDTYFSLVTETVYDYAYSFRTEKIWKPVAMGHPWIAVANAGYYRDIKNLGFRTFGHLIDESFDTIDNGQQRIERITAIVEDLCAQDLNSFLEAAQEVCKYNQQHLGDMAKRVTTDFPSRFFQFLQHYRFDE